MEVRLNPTHGQQQAEATGPKPPWPSQRTASSWAHPRIGLRGVLLHWHQSLLVLVVVTVLLLHNAVLVSLLSCHAGALAGRLQAGEASPAGSRLVVSGYKIAVLPSPSILLLR